MRRKGIVKISLKNNLKRIRERKGLTQLDVALRCNINHATYLRIEKGKSDPLLSTAFLISEILGESVDKLFSIEKEKTY